MAGPYENLALALDRLPNRFPASSTGIEQEILKRIFTPEEAHLGSYLDAEHASIETIAERTGLDEGTCRSCLQQMAKRGLVWFEKSDNQVKFRLAPFIVGIYEAQEMDHTLAHLFEQYMAGWGAKDILGSEPPLHRVIPAQSSIKSEWIMPYDDIRSVLESMKMFRVEDCTCRVERQQTGHACEFPTRMCLSFSTVECPPGPNHISKEEALDILDRAEEIGLVHTVSNTANGVGYVCNCCGCCCGILRGINEWGIQNSVAQSNFYAVIDSELCSGCSTCIERCQVKAISDQDGISVVDRQRCIGCGLCVTGCPNSAAHLEPKPADEVIVPPLDFTAWEQARQAHRVN